jgi:hypothetical protein
MELIGARVVDRGRGALKLELVLEYVSGRISRHPVRSIREAEEIIAAAASAPRGMSLPASRQAQA